MAVILVHSVETRTGAEVRGSRLRDGSPHAAVNHALELSARYSPPDYETKIRYVGDFVDPAFAELTQLAQQHGLDFEVDGA
jgi:hypothetical protein